eukprot:2368194-Rhodomonas_salina.1
MEQLFSLFSPAPFSSCVTCDDICSPELDCAGAPFPIVVGATLILKVFQPCFPLSFTTTCEGDCS